MRYPAPVELAYRLLHLRLAEARGAVVAPELLPGSPRDRAWLQGIADGLAVEDPGPDQLAWWLARLHARVLQAQGEGLRRRGGSFFTPPALVDHLLDHALEPTLDQAPDAARVTVLDPTCGPGLFLVAAARRLARRGVPVERAVQQVHGIDLDPGALELARTALWLELLVPGKPLRLPALPLHRADALLDPPPVAPVDVVIGNPPFLNQLERRTAAPAAVVRRLRAGGSPVGPYTDLSAVFLHRSLGWVREGGRVALVQPQSLLAARDAAGVRRHLAATGALEHLWASDRPVFDANVLTCAPVFRRGGAQGPVTRSHGPRFEPVEPCQETVLGAEWSFLLAAGLGVPAVRLRSAGVIGDQARCTADFRDQYYGLAGLVHEHADCPGGAPLVTTGLVEPAQCLWGRRPARFQKRRWQAPVVDLAAVEGPLAGWAQARLVPKVLVGTQGRVVEAVVDSEGAWLPSVPTITVVPHPARLWHLLAVLLAPPVTAHAAATYAGTALSMRAVKLSARQVARLPLPVDLDAWDEGAAAARAAQLDPARRTEHLQVLGGAMCLAYGVEGVEREEVLGWWLERAGLTGPR